MSWICKIRFRRELGNRGLFNLSGGTNSCEAHYFWGVAGAPPSRGKRRLTSINLCAGVCDRYSFAIPYFCIKS
jgi:hypothetical protein